MPGAIKEEKIDKDFPANKKDQEVHRKYLDVEGRKSIGKRFEAGLRIGVRGRGLPRRRKWKKGRRS